MLLIRNDSDLVSCTSFCELSDFFMAGDCGVGTGRCPSISLPKDINLFFFFLIYVVHIPSQLLLGLLILNLVHFHYFKGLVIKDKCIKAVVQENSLGWLLLSSFQSAKATSSPICSLYITSEKQSFFLFQGSVSISALSKRLLLIHIVSINFLVNLNLRLQSLLSIHFSILMCPTQKDVWELGFNHAQISSWVE